MKKSRRPIYLGLLIFLLLVWLLYRLPAPAVMTHPLPQQVAPKGATTDAPAPNPPPPAPTKAPQPQQCWDVLGPQMEKLCDVTCFKDYLKKKDPESYQLIEDGWFKPREQVPGTHSALSILLTAFAHAELVEAKLPKDLPRARKLLAFYIDQHPDNGWPMMFLAQLEHEANHEQSATHWLHRAKQAPRFENPMVAWNKKVALATLHDPRFMIHAFAFGSAMLLPSYRRLQDFLQERPVEGVAMAKALVGQGLRVQGAAEFYHWAALDYAVGRSLLLSLSPADGAELPNHNELPARAEYLEDVTGDGFWSKPSCTKAELKAEGMKLLRQIKEFD